MALTDQPYLPLYVDDWMNNSKLKLCSPGAHGLMVSIMCLMHKSETYGIILLKQKYKQTDKQILNFAAQVAKQTSFDLLDVQSYLTELLDEKVLCLDGDQLVCFRMVKDAKTSLERSKSGKKGGDQTQKFAQAKHKANDQANTGIEIETVNGSVIEINIDKWPFENFWDAYAKKQDRTKCERKWANLKDEEREEIMKHVPRYVASTPDIQFRKHPATYLNNRSWENEIIHSNGKSTLGTKQQQTIDTAKAVAELYGDVLGKGQAG